jgi:hypothetical protein
LATELLDALKACGLQKETNHASQEQIPIRIVRNHIDGIGAFDSSSSRRFHDGI